LGAAASVECGQLFGECSAGLPFLVAFSTAFLHLGPPFCPAVFTVLLTLCPFSFVA
jgi:hypothetical protein